MSCDENVRCIRQAARHGKKRGPNLPLSDSDGAGDRLRRAIRRIFRRHEKSIIADCKLMRARYLRRMGQGDVAKSAWYERMERQPADARTHDVLDRESRGREGTLR